MQIQDFIVDLEKKNFTLVVENKKLILKANRNLLSEEAIRAVKEDQEIIGYIKSRKEELIEYLSQTNGGTKKNADNIESIYRLSSLQEGMLFHSLYDAQGEAYIMQFSCDLTNLDLPAFRNSWDQLLKQHSILRSAFYYDAFNIPVQCVYTHVKMPIELLDLRGYGNDEQQQRVREFEGADSKKTFSFKTAPVMRITLLQLSDDHYRMVWTRHHILFDGWSLPVLMDKFLNIYEAFVSGSEAPAFTEDRYEDYIRYIERQDKEAEEQYWTNYLKGLEGNTLLPFISGAQRNKGVGIYKREELVLNQQFTTNVNDYARQQFITVNTVIQGVWAYLLHQYTGNHDIVYGATVSGRPEDLEGVEHRVGMYINTLPVRSVLNKEQNIKAWFQQIQQEQAQSRQYQHTSLSSVREWTGIVGDLFDNIVVFENYPIDELLASNQWKLQVDNVESNEHNNFPLSVEIGVGSVITVRLNYNSDLLPEFYAKLIAGHFEQLLKQIITAKAEKLSDLRMLTAEEEKQLDEFNTTYQEYPRDSSIPALFAMQAAATPNARAVVFANDAAGTMEQLTYRQLDERSNQVANYLIAQGIKPGDRVGFLSLRTIEMIIGMLGILKGGAIYVPFNTSYPSARLQYIMENAGISKVLYTDAGLFSDLALPIDCGIDMSVAEAYSSSLPSIEIEPCAGAYIMYTSGTTGNPKGILATHKNIIKLAYDTGTIRVFADDHVIQWSNYAFDGCTYEIYNTLLCGACLHIIPDNAAADPDAIAAIINRYQITVWFVTTALFNAVADANMHALQGLRLILVGGEALSVPHMTRAVAALGSGKVANVYGPTETTTYATVGIINEIGENGVIPIGKPLSNTRVEILNDDKLRVPVGVTGEMYIGGDGVATGYVNNEEQTKEKFISLHGEGPWYRTGDFVRRLPDGSIQFIGRKDNQVKMRGYRIELGEIESVLQSAPGVMQVAVIIKEDQHGEKKLIGYTVTQSSYDESLVKAYMQEQLPAYMIPDILVRLEQIPLTSTGKVDRKNLPAPEILQDRAGADVQPRNKLEQELAGIWEELLDVEKPGIHENFFELGGHSLLAIRLISAIRKNVGKEVSIKDVFDYPTIEGLSAQLEGGKQHLLLPVIQRQERKDTIPLSFAQERLWFIDRLQGSVQYHMTFIFRLGGAIDLDAVEKAFRAIVNRHEILRTVIKEQNGAGMQVIRPADEWRMEYMSKEDLASNKYNINELIEQKVVQPFDLSNDTMLRVTIVQEAAQEYRLLIVLHHIAFDGWSISVMVRELAEAYAAFKENREAILKPLPIQYADYAIWQRSHLSGDTLASKLDYWKKQLHGITPLELHADHARPAGQSIRGGAVYKSVSKEIQDALNAMSKKEGVTLFMVLLSAFKVLLYRYTGQHDICVGTPVAGRQQHEIEGLIGFFVNTLALRNEVNAHQNFKSLLQQVRQTTLQAYEHQDVPFEKVVETLGLERDMSSTPVFQVTFALENMPDADPLDLGGASLVPEGSEHVSAQFDLSLDVGETSDGLRLAMTYCSDIFEEATIVRMLDHYHELLQAIVADHSVPVGRLPMLTTAEQELLLEDYNDTAVQFAATKTIINLFEEQVSLHPHAVALMHDQQSLTYQQLDERANQLAHYLMAHDAGKEKTVGICLDRTPAMIISILAVLKSGSAYVPIDPSYPADRKAYMLNDSNCSMIITSKYYHDNISTSWNTGEIISFDEIEEGLKTLPAHSIKAGPLANNLAYIIYTSGSTGMPKGVMVEHASVANLIHSRTLTLGIDRHERILQFYNFSFDVSVEQVFLALCNGAVLVLLPQQVQMDSSLFENFLLEQHITHFDATPGFVSNIKPGAYQLKRVICGGEVCPATLAAKWASYVPFYNAYGPTEATITATTFKYQREIVGDNGNLPIGRPGDNVRIYITDRDLNLVPQGVAGELLIGGKQVARGYLNNELANAKAFIADPFVPGGKLYRTGDLAKWMLGGNLNYLGRLDEQVKVRGYRVEPAEVERALLQSPGIEQSVVIAKADKQGNKRLIAYVVAGENFDREKTAEYLRSRLPEYMVPGIFIPLQFLPLNANGKIDKTRLPLPDESLQDAGNFVEAKTTVEKQLAEIWQQLLGVERIGIYNNFFELGGHSLMAMRLVSAIRNTLHCEVPIREIFYHPTIAGLSQRLAAYTEGTLLPPIARLERSGSIPLSFAQERLWFIDRLKGSAQYHFSCVFTLTGSLNIKALESSFKEILRRHEVLRTVIVDEKGQGRQLIKSVEEWSMQYVNGASLGNESEVQNYIEQLTRQPYDLSTDPILRASLISVKPGEHILGVVLHHIAFDGWSVPILVEEFTELYRSFVQNRKPVLRELPVQYADYAIWQRQYLSGQILETKIDYWKQRLAGVQPLQLPTDHKRPAEITTRGNAVGKLIDKSTGDRLQKLSQQEGTTLFMTLLTVFKVLLYRYTSQQDICVGTPVAGRKQVETEGLMGFFNNMLSLRSTVNGEQSFRQLLQQVKATTLEAYEHEDVPFEKVVEALGVERDRSRSPLFQVAFVFQNVPGSTDFDLDGVTLTAHDSGMYSSHYDLNMDITESAAGISLNILFATDLFKEQTVARMLDHYEQLLQDVLVDADKPIDKLHLLTDKEKQHLLIDFNDTSVNHRSDNVITLFAEQAAANPNALALFFKGQEYTYKQLDDWSAKLANYLRFKGVQQGDKVPVCMKRGPELVAGILAILKTSACYIPVDPAYPTDRINYMLADAGARHILTSKAWYSVIHTSEAEIICVEDAEEYTATNDFITADAGTAAYIIYTSGTTGNPKGVMISHASLCNLTGWHKRVYNLTSQSRTTLLAGVGFDASVWEMWSALACGASIFIIEDEQRLEVETLVDFYAEHKITHSFIPTALVKEFISHANKPALALQFLLTGGDQLPAIDTSQLGFAIVNNYGPTENTVVATYYPLNDHNTDAVPLIGKPVDNTRIYILDDARNLQPLGVPGELCIGGAQVAMGYLNQPLLSAEKFVNDPFTQAAGAKIYRSGDLARWMPDGNIEFLGRKDDQVKIRGYRVELGEIESALQTAPGVLQAVVIAKSGENNDNKRLIAYVVPDATWNKAAAIDHLQSKLPEYMIPSVLMELDELPLTANGKVDKKQLPDPDSAAAQSGGYHAPRNEAEQQLAEIWEELLGAERVGIRDNFFELGGDSIITIQVVSRARRLGLDLQVGDMFSHQTIAALSAVLNGRTAMPEIAKEQETLNGSSGLLPIQQWFFESDPPQLSHYNQSVLLAINKNADVHLLQDAIGQLMQHHDALRFRYTRTGEGWRQDYRNYIAHLQIENIHNVPDNLFSEFIQTKCNEYQQSLDIENGVLVRAVLFETPEQQEHNRLLIAVHHLAVDGVSWRILLEDLEWLLTGLYDKKEVKLGNKTSSYRSWYEALERYSQSNDLREQANYWNDVVRQESTLPVDKARKQQVTINETQSHLVRIGSAQTKQLLHEVPKAYHTEINDILMAALCSAICKWSNNSHIVIGLEGHGRESINGITEDISRTVGWFTNMYPVMLSLEPEAIRDEAALVKSIKEQLRKVPAKGMGYGVLKYICKEQSLQGKDPWNIVFNYLGQIDNVASRSEWFYGAAESAGESISSSYPVHEKIAINSLVTGGELMLNWTYSTADYEEATIQSLADAYINELKSIIAHCTQKAKEGSTLTPSDVQMDAIINWKEFDRFMMEQGDGSVIESMYPLSGLQEGMLFHSLYDDQQSYVNQFVCGLVDVNVDAFAKSWQKLAERHTVLRTAFYHDAFAVPVQCVYKKVEVPVTLLDMRSLDENEQQKELQELKESDRRKSLNFRKAPLMRVTVVRLTEERYYMMWTHHHILFDGWSMPILMQEFLDIYDSFVEEKPIAHAEEDRYETHIRYLQTLNKEQERAYWQQYMQGLEHGTLLPFIAAGADRTSGLGEYAAETTVLDEATTALVNDYVHRAHITVNTLVQGVWAYLLYRYTGNANVCYGVTVSGRAEEQPGIERAVGMYINTLPLHVVVQEGDKAEDLEKWLQSLQQQQVMCRKYQHTPLSSIREWMHTNEELFDTLLVFENYPVDKVLASKNWKLQVESIEVHTQTNYPLSLTIGSGNIISLRLNYNTRFLQQQYMQGILAHFAHVLQQITTGTATTTDQIELVTPAEKEILLETFGRSTMEYPMEKTIVDLFEEHVSKTPGAIALVFEEKQLTYKELDEEASLVAGYLQSLGLKQEEPVMISVKRSAEMIIGILAILKAGGAFVPVDPNYPEERIAYMLQDTNCRICIGEDLLRQKCTSKPDIKFVDIIADRQQIVQNQSSYQRGKIAPHSLVYVIYTSGSTGRPKGVMIEHQSLADHIHGILKHGRFSECKSFLLLAPLTADAGHSLLFGALASGGAIHILPDEVFLNGAVVTEYIAKHKIDCGKFVPSLWLAYAADNHLPLPRKILQFGGEALPVAVPAMLAKEGFKGRVYNHYGPTETSIGKTICEIDVSKQYDNIPIGRPFSNTQVYIADAQQRICPVGVAGELYIGGHGVARSYLNNPELTKQKFVANPFANDGAVLYKTGDLCRWTTEGDIEYLGRIDEQVKLRGYRVEPGEIANVLEQAAGVKRAAVILTEDKKGEKRLAAYVVAEASFDADAATSFLKQQLPEYMIPAIITQLDELPLSANGKLDKKRLPKPETWQPASHRYTAPRNPLEQQMQAIWEQLLGTERIGIYDSFFESGGHSLLAMRLIAAVRKQLAIEIVIKNIFSHPTIAGLCECINGNDADNTLLVPPVEVYDRSQPVPLSFAQERLWFIHRLQGSIQYHMPWVFRLHGELDATALEASFREIILRHEVLRTTIQENDGNAYQVIQPAYTWQMDRCDETSIIKSDETLRRFTEAYIDRPFDLTTGHPIRVQLVQISPQEHLLIVVLHHIAFDGWSISILVDELTALYKTKTTGIPALLKELPVQYADYSIWQRRYLSGDLLAGKLAYWKAKLQDVARLELPVDYSRSAMPAINGAIANGFISKQISDSLQRISHREGTTLFMTLLAAFKILLHRYTGQTDICVGTPVAGRQQQETESLIGLFINSIALRTQVEAADSFSTLLKQVKQTTLEAFQHQDIPFEKVVEATGVERDLARNPLFQVIFSLRNIPEAGELNLGEATLVSEDAGNPLVKLDITIDVIQTPEGLHLTVLYSRDLFRADTITRMISHYARILQQVANNTNTTVDSISLLADEEKEQILHQFNADAVQQPGQTVIHLFQQQALHTPQSIALVAGEQSLTYHELDLRATRLACHLRYLGIVRESLVAVFLERSPEMVIAILAVWKAGAAYVPVDPAYPSERVQYILDDTQTRVVLTSNALQHLLPYHIAGICVENIPHHAGEDEIKTLIAEPEDLAYVIYTSGSTGRPKGVMIEHGSLLNYTQNCKQLYTDESSKAGSFMHLSFTFDASLTALVVPLLCGKYIVIGENQGISVFEDENLLRHAPYDFIKLTPAHLPLLEGIIDKHAGSYLTKKLVVGGEALQLNHFNYLCNKKAPIEIINEYGPTEATVGCSTFSLHTDEPIPATANGVSIGQPMRNNRIYITGSNGSLSPVGVAGELCIGGSQLARGYLNQPALTKEKFVADPFSVMPGARMYRTGDQARWLPDGTLEYIGRNDQQVKIRGYRVELGEIEGVLQKAPGVQQAIVIAKENNDGKQLAGFIVTDAEVSREAVLGYLSEHLPDYMIPSLLVQVNSIPLTVNGKVDRRQLLLLAQPSSRDAASAPRDEVEQKLVDIWKELLAIEHVGIYDDFFELGGHSLQIMRLVAFVRTELAAEVPLNTFFELTTIESIARYIRVNQNNTVTPSEDYEEMRL